MCAGGALRTRHQEMRSRPPFLTFALALAAALLFVPGAQASGTPNISLDKTAPATVLFGSSSTVTLKASNPVGQPTGYNLSFRDVLPAGISYVPGSSDPLAGEPTVINNAPAAGQTTLIWSNVSDLTANSSYSFTYKVAHSTVTHAVGDTYTNNAGAFINCDPRYVPDFNNQGVPIQSGGNQTCTGNPPETSYTGSATDSAQTQITAIELNKSEPSPENELLRGLHDQQTTYTLKTTNNAVNPTTNLKVEDYLPAALEFLGCMAGDNTTDAPTNPGSTEEYPGSGPITGAAPPGCVTPTTVETVQDPAGLPPGIYTHVVWTGLGSLAPGATNTITYKAAIPIRANTLDWNGAAGGNGTTPPNTGAQGSNLDNNSGPETAEAGQNEPTLTNYGTASGVYQDGSQNGLNVSDEDQHTVTSEDLRILKSVSSPTLGPGAISTWTLHLDTGEYRFEDGASVTDTLGDGYCPLGTTNLEHTPPASSAECDPSGGNLPSAPYTSTTENADGSWTLLWNQSTDPALTRMEPNSSHTITFPTRTRTHYQENFANAGPLLSNDSAKNDVSTSGNGWVICAPGDPSPTAPGVCDPGTALIDHTTTIGTLNTDVSSAGQAAAGPTIDKRVASVANSANCATATYVDTPPPAVRPGDTLCYRVSMSFPNNLESGGVNVTDFVPPGTTYVPGSTIPLPGNTATIASALPPEPDVTGSKLSWPLDDGTTTVQAGKKFDVVFRVNVTRLALSSDGDILDNLEKAVYSNTAGTTFPLRDSVGFDLAQPEIALTKGVQQINAGAIHGPNFDGPTVDPGDTVTFRVDVTNSGSVDASNAEVWDNLPASISCADVSAISNSGTCDAINNRIVWTGIGVLANASTTLTYKVLIPQGPAPGDVITNTAGVRTYESPSGSGPFTNVPSNNIDPSIEGSANAGPAKDPSNVVIEGVAVAKARTTQISETGNDANTQATIGERIDYTLTATIPDGVTLYGTATKLLDNIQSDQTLVPGSASATLDDDAGGPDPAVAVPTAGLTLATTATSAEVDFPNPYANTIGSGDDVVVLKFSTTVNDAYPTNYAQGTSTQQTLSNQGSMSWKNAAGTSRSQNSNTTNTTVVEPNISIAKTSNGAAILHPDDIVTFTVTGTNGSGARVSTAHDPVIVDNIPTGLTPVNGGVPVADGGTVNPDGGIWNETLRTITWTIADLAPGASKAVHYDARVDEDAIASSTLTNTAGIDVSSMPGTVTGERTAASPGSPPGYHAGASHNSVLQSADITKSSTPANATVGDVVTQTLTVTVPAFVKLFDTVVVDDIPDGLAFDSYTSASCTAGCSPGPTDITPVTLGSVPNGNGTRIGWSLGDIASAPVARTVTLVYKTHVAEHYANNADVLDGQTLQNTANLAYNQSDKVAVPPTSPPDPTTFDTHLPSSATTTVKEPNLVLDKDVSGDPDDDDLRGTNPGDTYTFTIKVTNNGDAPAYDAVVTDQPDSELTNVVANDGPGYTVTDGWTAGDPAMSFLIPGPIAPGDTVTITYTASLVPSAQLSDLEQITNTADVPDYFGVPVAERTQNGFEYRDYDNVADDTVTMTVHLPDLTIVKTTGAQGNPDDAPAHTETPFGWHIVITNPNAGSQLLGVDVHDVLPNNWSYDAGSAQITGTGNLTPGGQVEPALSGQNLDWSNVADLDGGETVVIDFTATPAPAAAINPGVGVAHTNTASASGQDTSGATGDSTGPYSGSDDATGTLANPDANLAITKTADDPTPVAGTDTSWSLDVRNDGPMTAPSVTVTDTLPAGLSFVSANPSTGSCNFAAGTLTCTLGEMTANQHITIAMVTHVDPSFAGQQIDNSATVMDPTLDEQDTSDNTDDDTVTPVGSADMAITKTLTSQRLLITKNANYELVVTNNGPSDAHDVTVTDTLPDELQFVSVDNANCSAVGRAITCNLGTMTPGQSITIEVTVKVVGVSRHVINPADVSTTDPDPDPSNNHDETDDPDRNADFKITKKGPKTLTAGTKSHYTLIVTNVSHVTSGGTVTVSDTVPDELTPLDAHGAGWKCDIAGQKVTCTRHDGLAPGHSYPPIFVIVKVDPKIPNGHIRNVGRVHLPGDTNPANDRDDFTSISGNAHHIRDLSDGGKCSGGSISVDPDHVTVGNPAGITATVLDKHGHAVKGITVVLATKPGGQKKTDKTDHNGRAMFSVNASTDDQAFVAKVVPCNLLARVQVVAVGPCHPDKAPTATGGVPEYSAVNGKRPRC